MNDRPDPARISDFIEPLRDKWRWLVALGVLLMLLGLFASVYVLSATLASVLFVGVAMIVGGIGQLWHAWRATGSRFLTWSLIGALYTLAGVLVIYDPLAAAAWLTLLLGAFLIAVGALRLWVWLQHRAQQGWQWLTLSGALTLAVGVLIAAGWPDNSLWLLGLLLAIDLLLQGVFLLMLGLALRRTAP